MTEAEQDKADAERYRKIRRLAEAHSKKSGLVVHSPTEPQLKAAASFRYWCLPEELDALIDKL